MNPGKTYLPAASITSAPGGAAIFRSIRVMVSFSQKMSATYRSEEHTSELQSQIQLVCRLLLEKKNHHRNARVMLMSLWVLAPSPHMRENNLPVSDVWPRPWLTDREVLESALHALGDQVAQWSS